jgi:hypothetical protein
MHIDEVDAGDLILREQSGEAFGSGHQSVTSRLR